MNTPENQLERLLHAAAGRASSVESAPPFGLEARVLAAWRSARGSSIWDTAILVRGLAVAAVLVLISIYPAIEQETNADSENLQFADSSVSADSTP